MLELKPLSHKAISGALEKAERYRLLNEPQEAESICRDVLLADPGNQQGLIVLLLALTDQFAKEVGVHLDEVSPLLPQLNGKYERVYYEGVMLERWGKARLAQETPHYVVNDWLRQAMHCYEKAEVIHPPGNDEAILRWNACARIIKRISHEHRDRSETTQDEFMRGFDEEVPLI